MEIKKTSNGKLLVGLRTSEAKSKIAEFATMGAGDALRWLLDEYENHLIISACFETVHEYGDPFIKHVIKHVQDVTVINLKMIIDQCGEEEEEKVEMITEMIDRISLKKKSDEHIALSIN